MLLGRLFWIGVELDLNYSDKYFEYICLLYVLSFRRHTPKFLAHLGIQKDLARFVNFPIN